ncbi:PREDICTED: uncharacterized protein LOC109461710 [Branchiostoma belcheri]|uniref:Uncharacterized protein LOC109461710 n=1 Tax=Branchiostoma belcheri TaxID=7741 RepID=A0A6P4XB23_BRABE|nr:PREDICTED: uncharacterized protein LOC109461710 [Branchiostoma belcheri]
MFLELRDKDRTHCITDIWLKDGYLPQIDGEGPGLNFQLEPAVWFKVLLLETVRINCHQQVLRWVTYAPKGSAPESAANGPKEIYGPGGFYDYDDDQDNLFDIAGQLLERDSATKEYKQDLFRLLHCYVLPVIRLTSDDLPLIDNMLEMQMCLLNGADNELQQQFQVTDGTKRIMREHRSDFARKVVNQEICLKDYSKDFLEEVKKGLEDDITIVREKLNDVQKKVNQAKEDLKNLKIDGRFLERVRETRDGIKTHLEILLKGMAEIKNFLELRKKKRSSKWMRRAPHIESAFHSAQEQLGEQREKQKSLLDKKLLLVSVKEALRLAIGDLHEDRDTAGLETSVMGGARATDVLESSTWSTLGERVSKIVHTSGDPIADEHKAFCKWVVNLCQAGSAEEELRHLNVTFQRSTDLSLSLSMHEARLNSSSSSDDEFVIIHDMDVDPNENCVRKLKTEIHKHFKKMTKRIAERELKPNDVHFVRKVWLYYEMCFFTETMDAITALYELAYGEEVQQLCTALERLKVADMEIRDSWILSLFPEMVGAEESSETESAGELTTPTSGNSSGEDNDNKPSDRDSLSEAAHPRQDKEDKALGNKSSNSQGEIRKPDRDRLSEVANPGKNASQASEDETVVNKSNCRAGNGANVQGELRNAEDSQDVLQQQETLTGLKDETQSSENRTGADTSEEGGLTNSANVLQEQESEETSNDDALSLRDEDETVWSPRISQQLQRPPSYEYRLSYVSLDPSINEDIEQAVEVTQNSMETIAPPDQEREENTDYRDRNVSLASINEIDVEIGKDVHYDDEDVAMAKASSGKDHCRTPMSESACESDLEAVRVRLTFRDSSHSLSADSGLGASTVLGNSGQESREKMHDLPLVLHQQKDNTNTTPKSAANEGNCFRERTTALDRRDILPPKRIRTTLPTNVETVPRKDSDETLNLLEMVHARKERNARRRRSTHFFTAIDTISEVLQENTPLKKLQALSKSLRDINERVGQLRTVQGQDSHPLGCDDLVTVLMLVLLEAHIPTVLSLYTQLRLLEDLMAPFLETGCHGYALVQFQMALQYLQSKV